MKLLETRQVPEEICLMSWSPKMDLIALGTTKGEVILHRLSWQKVWQINLTEGQDDESTQVTPALMAWHPDGIFLATCAGSTCYIVDVECGKLIHRHEMQSGITAAKWCATEYELSMGEVLATQARLQSDFLRSELKFQHLESLLSALIIAVEDGLIHIYTGGFLFAIVLKIPMDTSKWKVLQVDTTKSLQSFQFLISQCDGPNRCFSLSNFRTENFKKVSTIVGPLGFKYTFFLKSWSLIQTEITNLNDQWGKLVDVYQGYMTYGSDKELHEVKADYMELLFTGISTVELEIFLGKAGREKEIKKHTNTVNSITNSIMEHLRNIKCAIVFALMDLNEIGGFLKISRVEDAGAVVGDLRKAFSYLYIGTLHIQVLIHGFVEKFLHFFHLLLNTIHFFNIQEVPDFIEEDTDVDCVLGFLDLNMSPSVFEFLIQNSEQRFKDPPPCLEEVVQVSSKRVPADSPQFPFVRLTDDQRWKSFSVFMEDFIEKHPDGFIGDNLILDFTQAEVLDLFTNAGLTSTIDKMIAELLSIPALSTLPFSASIYPIASIPNTTDDDDEEEISGVRIKQSAISSIVYLHRNNTTYLFDINLKNPAARSFSLKYSSSVKSCDLFSDSVLSILSVSEGDSQQQEAHGSIFQINLDKVMENSAVTVDLQKFLGTPKQKFAPTDLTVELQASADSSKIEGHGLIDSSVDLEAFVPSLMAVSGARKLGAVLSKSKKQILLVDMEPESGENSYDDEGTAEFSSETLSEVSL